MNLIKKIKQLPIFAVFIMSVGSSVSAVPLNTDPEITSVAVTSVHEDSFYTYELNATDIDNNDLNWSVTENTSLPSWLRLEIAFEASVFSGNGLDAANDGNATESSFYSPRTLTFNADGTLYVGDFWNNYIRKVDAKGNVKTFTSTLTVYRPGGLVFDSLGNLYETNSYSTIIKIDSEGNAIHYTGTKHEEGSTDGNLTEALYNYPGGMDFDINGNLYVADTYNHIIRKIDTNGNVSTVAGTGSPGSANGNGINASFDRPVDLVFDSNGNLFITDSNNFMIRKIDQDGNVTTFAGGSYGGFGDKDGQGTAAKFMKPRGITIDSNDNLYVADSDSRVAAIRLIDTSGTVSTIAEDGLLEYPYDVAIDRNGVLFVADESKNQIIKIPTITQLIGLPLSNDVGIYDISLTVDDGNGGTDIENFQITVANTDYDATYVNDTNYIQSFVFSYENLYGNTVTATEKSAPSNGTIAINGTQVIYTPESFHDDEDSFTLTFSDNNIYEADKAFEIKKHSQSGLPVLVMDQGTLTSGQGQYKISNVIKQSSDDMDLYKITAGEDGKLSLTQDPTNTRWISFAVGSSFGVDDYLRYSNSPYAKNVTLDVNEGDVIYFWCDATSFGNTKKRPYDILINMTPATEPEANPVNDNAIALGALPTNTTNTYKVKDSVARNSNDVKDCYYIDITQSGQLKFIEYSYNGRSIPFAVGTSCEDDSIYAQRTTNRAQYASTLVGEGDRVYFWIDADVTKNNNLRVYSVNAKFSSGN